MHREHWQLSANWFQVSEITSTASLFPLEAKTNIIQKGSLVGAENRRIKLEYSYWASLFCQRCSVRIEIWWRMWGTEITAQQVRFDEYCKDKQEADQTGLHPHGTHKDTVHCKECIINPPNPQTSLYLLHLLLVQNTELNISLQFFPLIHFYLKDNYNIVLISALHQHGSAIYICLLPLEPPSKLPPHPTLLGCHRTFLKF